MWLLVFAFFTTIIGPPLYVFMTKNKQVKRVADTFILVLTAGIILFQVLPETFHELGIWSIVLAFIGTGLPGLIESLFRRAAAKTHVFTLYLGVLGLMLHGVIDGSALTLANFQQSGELLPIAILLHRTPVSLTLWWLVKPEFGSRTAAMVILMLLTGTLLGYLYAEQLISSLQQPAFMAFQALVSGTLLHVLYHRPGHSHGRHTHPVGVTSNKEIHDHSNSLNGELESSTEPDEVLYEQPRKRIVFDRSLLIGSTLAILVLIVLLHLHDIVG